MFSSMIACNKEDEHAEIVQILLEKGADPRIKNKAGKKAVDFGKLGYLLFSKINFKTRVILIWAQTQKNRKITN